MTPTFSDWLTLEVEPKIRIISELKLEPLTGQQRDFFLSEIARAAISPYHYWLQNKGLLPESVSRPTHLPNGASSLSDADKQWLVEVGIHHHPEGQDGPERYVPDGFLGKDLYSGAANRLEKIGFRWSKLQKAFIQKGV